MIIKEEISKQPGRFERLCQSHGVKFLWAFGSSTNDKFSFQTSDIDLLVEIDEPDPVEKGEKLISLWDTLEGFFQRKVDLLTVGSIKNPYLKRSIDSTKILIYDGTGAEIFI
jgi:predicted nucleotidyltransferase